jgi:large subunit ribosomal protein L21
VVDGASVRSRVLAPVRGEKIIVFKKKRRKGYKRKNGHRQDYYRVRVEAIEA